MLTERGCLAPDRRPDPWESSFGCSSKRASLVGRSGCEHKPPPPQETVTSHPVPTHRLVRRSTVNWYHRPCRPASWHIPGAAGDGCHLILSPVTEHVVLGEAGHRGVEDLTRGVGAIAAALLHCVEDDQPLIWRFARGLRQSGKTRVTSPLAVTLPDGHPAHPPPPSTTHLD
jgi:hypothetical protein